MTASTLKCACPLAMMVTEIFSSTLRQHARQVADVGADGAQPFTKPKPGRYP
jgi:hypothetical protein